MIKQGSFNKDKGSFNFEIPEISKTSGIPEITRNSPSEPLFDDLGKDRIDSLKKSILEIRDLIKEREKLSREIFNEGEKIKTEINNFILENESSNIASTALSTNEFLREKNDLRARKITISEMQLKEKIDCWKDIAILKKEMREYEKELIEKESRVKALNKILEEN